MRIEAPWLTDQTTQRMMQVLLQAGEAYFVGGCVRNAVLGVPVSDLDISTPLRPETVMDLAVQAGLKVIPTGIDHGTVTVVIDKTPFEITTFRKDIATDGRRAVVAFSDQITDDALRRDFTMNALYATVDGTIVDPLGGLPDLQARHVRFIEDANTRITEDYLRILRYFRFHAWYGNADAGLDAEAMAACADNLDGLDTLSKERITGEVLKLLAAPDPAQSLGGMQATGILNKIIPGADMVVLGPLLHLEQSFSPDPIRRLKALGGQWDARLRLSKKQVRQLKAIDDALSSDMGVAETAYRYGGEVALDAHLIRQATLSVPLSETLEADIARGAAAVFPVKAADLPNMSGRALGRKLEELEARWIASDFQARKDELLD